MFKFKLPLASAIQDILVAEVHRQYMDKGKTWEDYYNDFPDRRPVKE
jgi:hypothetical protein